MKIKTITCHDVYNFGATLQAYALMKYLELEGHEVEIIDYHPNYLTRRFDLWKFSEEWSKRNPLIKVLYLLYKLPQRINDLRGKYQFDSFKNKYLKVTDRSYHSNDELKNDLPLGDAYIAGSDQIWNTLIHNGKDPSFYLDFVPEDKLKISYAASFSIPYIISEYISFVSSAVKRIDFVSVREIEGLDILKSIDIYTGEHVLDPVFLLSKNSWLKLASKHYDEDYILVYDFDENESVKKFVKKIAKERDLKIYAINNYRRTPYADKDFYHSGPSTFLSLIRQAKCVVSNSFHGTAFSIIFEKEFYVFERTKSEVNTRMTSLLKICGLEDNLISSEADLPSAFNHIDYQKTKKRLSSYVEKSKSFLNNALDK